MRWLVVGVNALFAVVLVFAVAAMWGRCFEVVQSELCRLDMILVVLVMTVLAATGNVILYVLWRVD